MAYSYNDKYKGGSRNSVYDILQRVNTDNYINSPHRDYEAVDIDKVVIGGNTFKNYGAYQFIWEKSFIKSPERSANGTIDNLNSYATFLTPHLILDFSVMSIDDYRQIMQLHYSANEFIVECYDTIYNRKIKVKMYFATEEMAKLHTISQHRLLKNGKWEDWVDLVGVSEYKVELIGTNNNIDRISVIYHLNPPSDIGYTDQTVGDYDVYNGEEIIVGNGASSITQEVFDGRYKFSHWSTTPTPPKGADTYINGNVYRINQGDDESTIHFYAQWTPTTEHILSYNYGIADAVIDEEKYQYLTSKSVSYGSGIGSLPTVPVVKIKHKNKEGAEIDYEPYYNGAWYKTPVKSTNSVAVTDGELFWVNRDATIYLLYDTYKYPLRLFVDDEPFSESRIEYNGATNLPTLVKKDYNFDGWYRENGEKFSGNMPPYDINLYARWTKK